MFELFSVSFILPFFNLNFWLWFIGACFQICALLSLCLFPDTLTLNNLFFLYFANPYPTTGKKTCHTFPYQEVAVGERSRGGRLLEEPKMMLFKANTFSLQVSIQDVPQLLWSIKPFTTCQVGTSCVLSFRVKSRTCVNCVCMFSVCHGHAQWRKLCTFISFPVFLFGHIKARGQQQGHSRGSLWLAISPTHTPLRT